MHAHREWAKSARALSKGRERQELTRPALFRTGINLLSHNSLGNLSLRQVTRQAGITPAAYYGHFADMEELGLVLVGESFRSLGAVLQDARRQARPGRGTIGSSLAVLVRNLDAHPDHFRFIVLERFGGVRRLRRAVDWELQLFADELAIDLAAGPGIDRWTMDDRRMLASAVVDLCFRMVAELLEAAVGEEQDIVERAARQLRLLSLGVPRWSS